MPLIDVKQLTKEYPGVVALDNVSVSLEKGEVHGVMGENGAGKSTLMKLLAGVEHPTSGTISLEGKEHKFRGVREAEDAGIVMIHQELNLIDDLNVADNLFLGRERRSRGVLDRKAMEEETARWLDKVAASSRPTDMVRDLSIAQKQLVEIAKAVSRRAKVVIMDEPTAVLTERETRQLFSLVHDLKTEGVTVVFISHILEEMVTVCDRITVLRDGQYVGTVAAAETTPRDLAHMMVGRELSDLYPVRNPVPDADPLLAVNALSVPERAENVTITVGKGEIVGLAGLVGAGRTEVCEAIAGIRNKSGGDVSVDGQHIKVSCPGDAVRNGIAYLSEDRKVLGLHLDLPISDNMTLANLRAYTKPIVDRKRIDQQSHHWRERLKIKAGNLNEPVSSLSGGNQQKVSLAKWLDAGPRILILDEPTRGVDIGAKGEIYRQIAELAEAGMAVLMVSSEMGELIGLCDRVYVMRSGKVVEELPKTQLSEKNIMEAAAGVGQTVEPAE